MTYADAQVLLDDRREGAEIAERRVLTALELTGDISADQLIKALQELKK